MNTNDNDIDTSYPTPNDDDVKVARLTATEFVVIDGDFPHIYRWARISRCGVVVVMTYGYDEHFFLPANFTTIDLLAVAVRVYEAGWRAGHRRGTEYGKDALRGEFRRLLDCAPGR